MTDLTSIARTYIQSWNQLDAATRRATIDELFADACTYTDPMASVQGRAGVDGFIAAVQQQFAGVSFALAGPVDAHHDVARFTWHATVPGVADPVAIGFDVMTLEAGKIRTIVGFLDKAP
ncbi:MAG TPA: nuclear transport factor 2 family protein [Kofleriaceae bacterium]|jgi:hypothetical protein